MTDEEIKVIKVHFSKIIDLQCTEKIHIYNLA